MHQSLWFGTATARNSVCSRCNLLPNAVATYRIVIILLEACCLFSTSTPVVDGHFEGVEVASVASPAMLALATSSAWYQGLSAFRTSHEVRSLVYNSVITLTSTVSHCGLPSVRLKVNDIVGELLELLVVTLVHRIWHYLLLCLSHGCDAHHTHCQWHAPQAPASCVLCRASSPALWLLLPWGD